MLVNIVIGTVVGRTGDRIKLRPRGFEDRKMSCLEIYEEAASRGANYQLVHLDLPLAKTGRDMAFVHSYSLDFGKP